MVRGLVFYLVQMGRGYDARLDDGVEALHDERGAPEAQDTYYRKNSPCTASIVSNAGPFDSCSDCYAPHNSVPLL